jgi:hypothetical protein
MWLAVSANWLSGWNIVKTVIKLTVSIVSRLISFILPHSIEIVVCDFARPPPRYSYVC